MKLDEMLPAFEKIAKQRRRLTKGAAPQGIRTRF